MSSKKRFRKSGKSHPSRRDHGHSRRGAAGKRILRTFVAGLALCEGTHRAQAQTAAFWVNPVDGNWTESSKWDTDPFVPHNGNGGSTYDVTISAAGADYSVSLNTDVTIDSLTVSSTNAIVRGYGLLQVLGTASLTQGTYSLEGGTLQGGTWNVSPGASLSMTANSGNRLDGVTVNGDLRLNDSAMTRISGGTSFTTAHLGGSWSSLGFAPGHTLNGSILFEGANYGYRTVEMDGTDGTFTVGATGAIRTTADLNNQGYWNRIGPGYQYGGAMTLINNGLISSETAGQTVSIESATLTNNGTLQALNGGLLSIAPTTGAWTNAGTIAVDAGSIVHLGGTFDATGGIGTFSNPDGGDISVIGTLLNTGNSLTLNSATGSWRLAGGTVQGGSVNFADGKSLVITGDSRNRLDGVTINGDIQLNESSATTRISEGTMFTTAHLGGTHSSLGFAPGQTLTGSILFKGGDPGYRTVEMDGNEGTFTVGATGVIHTAADLSNASSGYANRIGPGYQYGGAMNLVNNGLISSETAGQTVSVEPATLTNNGTLQALNGGLLSITPTTGAWTNTGTIAVDAGSIVHLGGTFDTTGGIGTFSNPDGGDISVIGTLLNTGNTLTLNNSTGSWRIAGGTVQGGSVNFADGKSLVITSDYRNQLDGVAVNGDIRLDESSAKTRISGGASFTTAHLSGDYSTLGFAPGHTLNGSILFEGANYGYRTVEMDGNDGTFTVGATGSIRTAADLDNQGSQNRIGAGYYYGGAMTLINNGLISSETAGQTVSIESATLTNNGTLQALNGGILNIAPTAGAWTSTGTIALDAASTVNLGGTFDATGGIGTFSSPGGGTVNITGTLLNTGNALALNNSTGSWRLAGGTVQGGSLNFADGKSLAISSNSGNRLDGVTVNGDIRLDDYGASVRISGGTTFTTAHLGGNWSSAGFAPGQTLTGSILFEGSDYGYRTVEMDGNEGTFTVGASGVIRTAAGLDNPSYWNRIGAASQFGGAMTLINNGLISSETAGQTVSIESASLTNTGTLQAISGGTLNIAPAGSWSSGGTLQAINGSTLNITSAGSWSSSGTLQALNGSILNIAPTAGSWTNTGTIALDAGSTVNLGGTFDATGGIGTFSNSGGGTVNINGTLLNTGRTLTLNNSTGSWNLAGGTLQGGSLSFADGKSLVVTSNSNRLDGVTVNGDIRLDDTSARTRISGGTAFTTAHLAGSWSSLGFAPGHTLTGSILFEGANYGYRIVEMDGTDGTFTVGATGVIRTAADLNNQGYENRIGAGYQYGGVMTLVNNGLISSETAGQRVIIESAALTNSGTIQAVNGGTVNISAATSNYNAATSTLTGGTWRVVSDGSGTPSTLTLSAGSNITTNNASVLLSGADSVFTEINGLVSNRGSLTLAAGRDFTTAGALNNSGILTLAGAETDLIMSGTLSNTATGQLVLQGGRLATVLTLNNSGALSGFGTVTGRPVNHGTIRSSGGALVFSRGIQGGSGTVQIDPGSSLDLSAGANNSNGDYLIHNGTSPGSLNLGTHTFTVAVDYTNASSGSGNAYNPRANVAGTGQILAAGTVTQSLTGDVTGGATASPQLAFGNVHVGDSATLNYQVGKTSASGPALRGAIQTAAGTGNITDSRLSGTGVTGGTFDTGVTGTGGTGMAVTFTPDSAGSLTGQTVGIVNNFDNVAEQTLLISGSAYRYATVQSSPGTVAFGNFHVGDSAPSQALTLTNTAANDNFSEVLNASVGAPTGGVTTNGGSFSGLTPGSTDSASLSVGISTASAGSKNGTATLSLVSDGAGSSGLGQTALASQTVNVTGAVYRLAAPSVPGGTSVSFGIVHVGDTVSQAVPVMNTAVADGFSERLNAAFSGSTAGITTGGSLVQLSPGGTGGSLTVGLNTSAAGTISGTAALEFVSDGTDTSGLGQTALPGQVVNVTGQVNNYASVLFSWKAGQGTLVQNSPTVYTLDFGIVNNSGMESAPVMTLGLTNSASGPSDSLAGSYLTGNLMSFTAGGFSAFSGLEAGQELGGLTISMDNSQNGDFSGSLTFSAASQNSSGYNGALGDYVINFTATVVPEPAGVSGLLLTAAGLLGGRRRRRI